MSVLPTYRVLVDNDETLDFLSLVEMPATEVSMLKFSSDDNTNKTSIKCSEDKDKRMILAPVMLADTPIYRRDESGYEYNIVFDAPSIEKLAKNFFKRYKQDSFDIEHGYSWVSGIHVFQSMIIDDVTGIKAPEGFKDLPQGSWIIGAHVNNADLWDSIKEGKYTGLSLAGSFGLEQLKMSKDKSDEELIEDMKDMYKNLCKL